MSFPLVLNAQETMFAVDTLVEHGYRAEEIVTILRSELERNYPTDGEEDANTLYFLLVQNRLKEKKIR